MTPEQQRARRIEIMAKTLNAVLSDIDNLKRKTKSATTSRLIDISLTWAELIQTRRILSDEQRAELNAHFKAVFRFLNKESSVKPQRPQRSTWGKVQISWIADSQTPSKTKSKQRSSDTPSLITQSFPLSILEPEKSTVAHTPVSAKAGASKIPSEQLPAAKKKKQKSSQRKRPIGRGAGGSGYGEIEGGSVDFYSHFDQESNLTTALENAAARFHGGAPNFRSLNLNTRFKPFEKPYDENDFRMPPDKPTGETYSVSENQDAEETVQPKSSSRNKPAQ